MESKLINLLKKNCSLKKNQGLCRGSHVTTLFQEKSGIGLSFQSLISYILPTSFYEQNTLTVAQELLGKILIVQPEPDIWVAGRIIETEAYRDQDPASHSKNGKTPRASVMFEGGGVAYVYLIYGMYEMLNFVTEPVNQPGAVLIRALEPILGIDFMLTQRKVKDLRLLTSGPGRLCQALAISRLHNRESLQGPRLYVVNDECAVKSISHSPRVGIREGKDRFWRFFMTDHSGISRVQENQKAVLVSV